MKSVQVSSEYIEKQSDKRDYMSANVGEWETKDDVDMSVYDRFLWRHRQYGCFRWCLCG